MAVESSSPYESLVKRSQEVALLGCMGSLLHWDQQTYQPRAAAPYRASQAAYLSTLAHERWATQEVGDWLQAAEETEHSVLELGNLREWRQSYDRAVKLPTRLVEELSRESSLAHEVWVEARKLADFSIFAPNLEKLVELTREQAEYWGYENCRYDALLESYESGSRKKDISVLFDGLAPQLTELVVQGEELSSNAPLPAGMFPVAAQEAFNQEVALAFGFDFSSGRIDTTAHPFCTTLGPKDIRLTTRYDEQDFTSSLLGVLHEAGHGLYEQGLLVEHFGTPAGTAVSLGIHESQSRLWENHIGRSLSFWQHWFPIAVRYFPQLTTSSPEAIYRWVNQVKRSFIRVEADEVTYDLHIILRFRIEAALIAGELEVQDLPTAWNEEFQRLFGLEVPDDAQGCLQDVHWSGAGFGYFPTYTLGNLNAAALFQAAHRQIPTLTASLAQGNYTDLLGWLRENIHQSGSVYLPNTLMERATGSIPNPHDHLLHLQNKVKSLAE